MDRLTADDTDVLAAYQDALGKGVAAANLCASHENLLAYLSSDVIFLRRPREFLDLDYLERAMSRLPDEVRFVPKFVTQMSYYPPSWIPFAEARATCHYFAGRETGIASGLLTEAEKLFLARSAPGGA